MTQNTLSSENIASIKQGLENWAWFPMARLVSGVSVGFKADGEGKVLRDPQGNGVVNPDTLMYPASESTDKRNGIIRCAKLSDNRDHSVSKLDKAFLVSLRAGTTPDGKVPQDLLNAISGDKQAFLDLKNKKQLTITLLVGSHDHILSELWPGFRSAIPGQSRPCVMGFAIEGLRFATKNNAVLKSEKGTFIMNFDNIVPVRTRGNYDVVEAGAGITGSSRDEAAILASLGIEGGVETPIKQIGQQPAPAATPQEISAFLDSISLAKGTPERAAMAQKLVASQAPVADLAKVAGIPPVAAFDASAL